MTELLFHQRSYLQEFDATVTGVAEAGVALDRTAFYTGGGGQPSDIGVLSAGGGGTTLLPASSGMAGCWCT